MRKEDIIKFLMIYHNDYSTKFKNQLLRKHKDGLEEEFNKLNFEKLKKRFLDEKVYKVYSDLVFRGETDEDIERKNEFILIETGWGRDYILREEIREFLEKLLPKPKGYEIEYIECRSDKCNYLVKECIEAIKEMDIKIGSTNKVKKGDINKVKSLFPQLNETEISWLIFVAVKYFQQYKKFELKKFYDFVFFKMNLKDEVALFRMILFSIHRIRYRDDFVNIYDEIWNIFKKLKKCVTMRNLQSYLIYRRIGLYFHPYYIDELEFKNEYLKVEPYSLVNGRFARNFSFYEDYTLLLFKGFSAFLSVLGLLEVDFKENDCVVDVFYGNIYAAKLSNIGLWYAGYTNHLKLPSAKKSDIKVFNKILAVMFDESDVVLKAKIERFFTRKGNFYFLDDEKILRNITNKDELKEKIKEIKSIIKFPKNFQEYFKKLLNNFSEIKKVDFAVLEVDKNTLKKLEPLKDWYFLAEDNKIIVKDLNKFKKEAKKLGVFIKGS